jgi:hypothetical protein
MMRKVENYLSSKVRQAKGIEKIAKIKRYVHCRKEIEYISNI